METKIGKKVYRTEEMTEVGHMTNGVYGDPAGYEETLYASEDGKYFLFGKGGETSPYPTEKLVRLAKPKAELWRKQNA